MSRPRRAVVAVVLVAALALLAVPYLRAAKGTSSAAAPLFTSTDLSGQPVALSTFHGHRVILNFWASWCIPCRREFPVLKQIQASHPDVIILGVVFDDSDEPARDFLRSQGATWPGVRDPKAQIAGAYGVRAKPGIPVSVLIDPSGRIRARQYGPLPDQAAADVFVNQAPTG